MVNRRRKASSELQGYGSAYRNTKEVTLLPDADRKVPTAPKGLTKGAAAVWREFWRSPLGSAVDYQGDGPALRRWILLVSERERLWVRFKGETYQEDWEPLTVAGSLGQRVLNPLLKLEERLSREIMAYEDRFGMTPLARMRLGIAIGQMADSLDGLRERLARRDAARNDVPAGEDGVIDLDGLA